MEKTAEKQPERPRSLESQAWVYCMSKCYGLTLGEVANMKEGQKIKLLLLHDNVLEQTNKVNKSKKITKPELFFRNEYATYTHKNDVSGTIKFSDGTEQSFDFHLFIAPNVWHPLSKGRLKKLKSPISEDMIGKHYKEFDPLTLVGYRGAVIPWKNLSQLPLIHHLND